jgi:hypothetical protein
VKLLAFLLLVHQAPSGWAYPQACCSNVDCREVATQSVRERPDGYHVAPTGKIISYRDARVRESPDGRYHLCTAGGREDGEIICIFVPPKSF